MKIIILAGGTGTRLGKLTAAVNKQLLPIGNKPILCHTIEMAAQILQNPILNSASYRGPIHWSWYAMSQDLLIICNSEDMSSFANLTSYYPDLNIYFRNQDNPDGIASAIGLASSFCGEEPFVVLLGDNLYSSHNKDIICNSIAESAFREPDKERAMVWTVEHESPHKYGVLYDVEGQTRVIEKPLSDAGNKVITGCYFLNSQCWEYIANLKKSSRGEYEITDLLSNYAENNSLESISLQPNGWWDIGSSCEDYARINKDYKG
jgi:glucose-1-phosphate thymidylyltransferase